MKKMIETKERTLALEKAIEIQVNPSSLLKILNKSVLVFVEIASSSWSCKRWSPCSGTTIFLHGQGPRCHSTWHGLQEDFVLQWRLWWNRDHPPCTLYYCHITGEVNAQLSLSERLLNDITDTIGRKNLIVSKLAMKLQLYRLLCLFKGVQPDRLHWNSSGYFRTAASGSTSVCLPCIIWFTCTYTVS